LLLVVIRAPWPSDKHSPVKILAAGELDATPASRDTPPLSHRPWIKLFTAVKTSPLPAAWLCLYTMSP
jgi:hypothetical protein